MMVSVNGVVAADLMRGQDMTVEQASRACDATVCAELRNHLRMAQPSADRVYCQLTAIAADTAARLRTIVDAGTGALAGWPLQHP
jgi:hypothetical protein